MFHNEYKNTSSSEERWCQSNGGRRSTDPIFAPHTALKLDTCPILVAVFPDLLSIHSIYVIHNIVKTRRTCCHDFGALSGALQSPMAKNCFEASIVHQACHLVRLQELWVRKETS